MPSARHEADAVGRDRDELAVVREHHAPRLAQERGRVRGEEVLALAEPDHERRLEARADQLVGMVAVDDDEREVALHLADARRDASSEVAVVVALDQVGDGLGVGLGA